MRVTISNEEITHNNTVSITNLETPYWEEISGICHTYIGFSASTVISYIILEMPDDFLDNGGEFGVEKLIKIGLAPDLYAIHLSLPKYYYMSGSDTARTASFAVEINGEESIHGETAFIIKQIGCETSDPLMCTLTYNPNGGTETPVQRGTRGRRVSGGSSSEEYIEGETVTIKQNAFIEPVEGCSQFISWVDSDGKEYLPGDTFVITKDKTLFANWEFYIYYKSVDGNSIEPETYNSVHDSLRDKWLKLGPFLESENPYDTLPYVRNELVDQETNFYRYVFKKQPHTICDEAFSPDLNGNQNLKYINLNGLSTVQDAAFHYSENLEEVDFGSTLSFIGGGAFVGTSFSGMVLPNTVTGITSAAFAGSKVVEPILSNNAEYIQAVGWNGMFNRCSTLERIVIPGSFKVIGYNAFRDNINLEEVIINEGVVRINDTAFSHCQKLTEIRLPNSLSDISSGAFNYCTNLETVHIGSGLTSITKTIFTNDSKITNITVDENNPYLDSRDNCNAVIETETNRLIVGCKSTIIPNTVTIIGSYAFCYTDGISTIAIPTSVTTIEKSAFGSTSGFTSLTIPNSVSTIEGYAFNSSKDLESITLPTGITEIKEYTFSNCESLTSINIPEGVTAIGNYAFQNCESLTSINIPEGVTTIGNYAFQNCKSLVSINIPEGATNMGVGVFSGCSSLTSITIPSFIISSNLDYWVNGCSGLIEITVDPNNTVYDSRENCNAIIKTSNNTLIKGCGGTVIPDSVTSLSANSFEGCTTITGFTIPEQITQIKEGTFRKCINLEWIVLPDTLTQLNSSAFHGCESLKELHIGSGLRNISFSNFTYTGMANLTAITVDANNTTFDSRENCNAIVSTSGNTILIGCANTTFPSSITSIREYAFAGNELITELVIPSNITSIGRRAFAGCTSLTSITIISENTSIGQEAFSGCTSLSVVNLPEAITLNRIGSKAFSGCTSLPSQDGVRYLGNEILEVYDKEMTTCTIKNGVKLILEKAFSGCRKLETVILPNTLTSIGSGAFSGCSSLVNIVLPNSLEVIKSNAFSQCASIQSLIIPNLVTKIESSTFYGCSSITSITIPNSVNTIEYGAFWNCTSLINVEIPNGVEAIPNYTFCNCNNLRSITLPNTLTSIGGGAFSHCSALTGITIPIGVTIINKDTFGSCKSLTSLEIPNGVISIGVSAFENCENLSQLIIPETVTSIGSLAFEGCTSLTELYIPESVTYNQYMYRGCGVTDISIQEGITKVPVCTNCVNLTGITLPSTVTQIEDDTFAGCSNLTRIEFPPSLIDLNNGRNCFKNCTSLENLVLPIGFQTIPERFFQNCSSLTAVTLPDTITSIGKQAFNDCHSITNISLPSGITSIGLSAFDNCYSLESIHIPASVTSMGTCVLYNCHSLTSITVDNNNSVYDSRNNCNAIINTSENNLLYGCQKTIIPNGVTKIETYAFLNIHELEYISIPGSVLEIGWKSFYNCDSLQMVILHEGIERILANAFQNCTKLKEIIIPNTVTEINREAFGYCSSLKNVTLSNNITKITNCLFNNCLSLEEIIIPEGVTMIEEQAFYYNTSLSSVTIPSTTLKIDKYAFSYCTKLEEINYNGTKEQWNNSDFKRDLSWCAHSSVSVIHCTNGDIII